MKYIWLKGERDKKIEWHKIDYGLKEIHKRDYGLKKIHEMDNGLKEMNDIYYDKSIGDVRFSDDVMMELRCYEINSRTERWSKF